MSLNPESSPSVAASQPDLGDDPRRQKTWPKRLLRISIALFTVEIGLFLVIFPWTDYWHLNYFQVALPRLEDVWDEPAFRGALTGLGLVNIYIACLQMVNLVSNKPDGRGPTVDSD